MSERAITFGPMGGLVGVLSEPERSTRRDVPAVLLWNVGINHHVGPSRIWVDLARRLVRAGFVVLRFDLSGLGDSEPRQGGISEGERALEDIRDAMDAVTKHTCVRTFAVTGFCSGVDSAHAIAFLDERVVGAAFVEGYSYPTMLHKARRPLKVFQRRRWERWLTRRFPALARARGAARDVAAGEPIFVREYPKEERFKDDVRAMLERKKKLLFVYAGAARDHYSYKRQILDVLGQFRGRNVDVAFLKHADHVFSRLEARLALLDRMTVFFDTRFEHAPRRLP
ncbi:MAG TPA: alpha/beta fold hydrolase [Polyangiaceae bacterium]